MSILVEETSHQEVRIVISKDSYSKFKNGNSLQIAQVLIDRIQTQIEISENMGKKKKVDKSKFYSKVPTHNWTPSQFLSYIRDRHKQTFGQPIIYLNDNRVRSINAIAGLWRRLEAKSLTKEDMRAFIDWVYNDSDIDDIDCKTFLMNRYVGEWLKVRKIETVDKAPVLSNSFKSKMRGGVSVAI